ncbi:MAG: FAD:protein FMN transferase [Verrucomicrobia bacterium]|jgi:thiamine biosynthesis lipoprotein|nr:FAD:protein FMN transferase [Verrucomicrobiota bacterium]
MVKLALNAMNTRFELVLPGDEALRLRAAGEEALQEITRLDALLSAFKPTSEIGHVNARADREAVQVSPEVFGLLLQARDLWELTEGAFDITVGPLMRCWGFWGASGRFPQPPDVRTALDSVGTAHLQLDAEHRTVRFGRPGMTLDLGAIGKGYALDRAVELLRESGVRSGLLHSGTSTASAIGSPPDSAVWGMEIDQPVGADGTGTLPMPAVVIRDESLSVSSLAEKCFSANGRLYGHVMDPRTGEPVKAAVLTVVALPSAAEADAWSTALMVLGEAGLGTLGRTHSGARGLVVDPAGRRHALGLAAGAGTRE